MISALIISGFALCLTLFLVMQRTGRLKLFLGYAGWVDLIFTILIFGLFAHTFSGVVAGTFAGLFMALGLTMMRNLIGYERITRKGFKLVIVSTPPKWAFTFSLAALKAHAEANR
ncbi:holin class I [Rhizobium phage Paso]|uniref:Holin class I n=1 Tax=Rhizobium phage Paso TaxID=2767574 RepID=A0A7L8G4M9_9CAUD|nr:holin class I [Rhizobium phage Paso]